MLILCSVYSKAHKFILVSLIPMPLLTKHVIPAYAAWLKLIVLIDYHNSTILARYNVSCHYFNHVNEQVKMNRDNCFFLCVCNLGAQMIMSKLYHFKWNTVQT